MMNILVRKNKLRVGIVVGQLGTGGTEQQIYGLVQHFNPEIIRTSVICMSSKASPVGKRIQKLGIPLYVIEKRKENVKRRLQQLVEVLKSWNPDLIHSFGDAAGAFATGASCLLKLPHVHSVRSFSTNRGFFLLSLRNFVCRHADLVTANSLALSRHLRRALFFSKAPVLFTPNGIDTQRFMKVNSDQISDYIGEKNCSIVLYVGRDHPSKDIPTLLQVIRIIDRNLRGTAQNVCFVLIGRDLEKKTDAILGEIKHVKLYFPGEVEQIEPWIIASDLLLLTSRNEGMANVVLEAMAAARPVVSTTSGGCSEAIINGHTGFLVRSQNPVLIARAVQQLLKDVKLSERMGKMGRKHVLKAFNWDRACQAMISAYYLTLNQVSAKKKLFFKMRSLLQLYHNL